MTALSDRRAIGSPPSYTPNFSYNYASQATQVTQPDSTSLALTPVQLNGVPASGTGTSGNPATAVLLAASPAAFTDGNSHVWKTYLDGLGFGLPVNGADPLG